RIHAPPIGVSTAVSDRLSASNATASSTGPMPAQVPNAAGVVGPNTCKYRSATPRAERIALGSRHRPDGRLSRALPADQDRARRRGVPEQIRVHAEGLSRLAGAHPPTVEEGMQTSRDLLGPLPTGRIVRQPPEREERAVAGRHDIRAEPRAPDLDERRILPAGRVRPLDPRVDREERSPRHAVLQARPRLAPERARAARKPLLERA